MKSIAVAEQGDEAAPRQRQRFPHRCLTLVAVANPDARILLRRFIQRLANPLASSGASAEAKLPVLEGLTPHRGEHFFEH